jgi:hypothetical protein
VRSKNKPMMANAMPTIRCQDGGSRKKQDASHSHDRRATAPEWQERKTADRLLERAEKMQCSCAYADTSKHRINNSVWTRFLIPAVRQPEECKIGQIDNARSRLRLQKPPSLRQMRSAAIRVKICARHKAQQQRPRIENQAAQSCTLAYEMDHSREN